MFKKYNPNPFFLWISAICFLLLTAIPGFCGRVALTTIFPNEFPISDCEGLQKMQNNLSADYYLTQNIDCSMTNFANHPVGYSGSWTDGNGFEPIGYDFWNKFSGSFDGRGYEISELYINRPSTNYVGLFGQISGSETKNVKIEDVGLVSAEITGRRIVGSLVGYGYKTTITNCYSKDDGASPPKIPKVIGERDIGGLVAQVDGGAFTNCYTTGEVNAIGNFAGSFVGGLVACLNDNGGDVTLANCYSTANVTGDDANAGGLVAFANGEGISITDCHSTGNVEAIAVTGGLVATLWGATISNCYSTGNAENTVYGQSGGLFGMATNALIENSYATGNVKGWRTMGGLGGYAYDDAIITNCYSTGDVTGNGSVTDSDGIVYLNGDAGGLIGRLHGNNEIVDCYSTGDVQADGPYVGGLIGRMWLMPSQIKRSYSIGAVSGGSNVGGLIGKRDAGSVAQSYWNKTTSGQNTSAGGIGKTTAQMIVRTTYSGWDFSSIWKIDDGVSYPCLNWQAGSCLVP